MTLHGQRVTVFTVSSMIVGFTAMNLIRCIISSSFAWYNVIDVLVLLPSLLAAVLLVRIFVRRIRRKRHLASRENRLSINNGYVYPKKD